MKTESAILANVMDKTRALTNIYFNFLKDADLYKEFEIDGKKLNTAFWIMAHLPVTQNFLLLRSTGGDFLKIPWARQFGLGSTPMAIEDCPPLHEVKDVFKQVHEKSMAHIAQMDDAMLDADGSTGFEFAGEKTIRSLVIHSIRHEGTHAGHLGWLCKLHGIKTI